MNEVQMKEIESAVVKAASENGDGRKSVTVAAPLPVEIKPNPTNRDPILVAKEKTHGNYIENAQIVQALKFIMMDTAGWNRLTSYEAESLHLIATKIGRILSGQPHHKDHWDDIAGYAKLVSERV